MARRRRTRIRYSSSEPRRTPMIIYIGLAVLFFAGTFYFKRDLTKPVNGQLVDAYSGQPVAGTVKLVNDAKQAKTASVSISDTTTTDQIGAFQFNTATSNYQLNAQAPLYRPITTSFSNSYTVTVKMIPAFLKGVVHEFIWQSNC